VPNAHEYRVAATRLRAVAQEVDEHAFMLHACPVGDVFAGPIAGRVAEAIESVTVEINRATDGLAELVAVCDRRTGICQHYLDTVNAWWERNNGGDHSEPYPPAPPFSWVEL
jgi:hypothetical protein